MVGRAAADEMTITGRAPEDDAAAAAEAARRAGKDTGMKSPQDAEQTAAAAIKATSNLAIAASKAPEEIAAGKAAKKPGQTAIMVPEQARLWHSRRSEGCRRDQANHEPARRG